MWGKKHCPECGDKLEKVIYAGLPGKICTSCSLMMGLASWAALLCFNGMLFLYTGSYWRALWHWLFEPAE